MANPPVFLITGPAGHGKTTVRNVIAALSGNKGASCSDVIDHHIATKKGISVEELRKIPKEDRRAEQVKMGDWLTGQDGIRDASEITPEEKELYRAPSALVRTLFFSGYRVIDGVRRRLELQEAVDRLNWCGFPTKVLYVVNPNGPKIQDNTEDLRDLADHVIENSGTKNDLALRTHALLNVLFPEPEAPAKPAPASDLVQRGPVPETALPAAAQPVAT